MFRSDVTDNTVLSRRHTYAAKIGLRRNTSALSARFDQITPWHIPCSNETTTLALQNRKVSVLRVTEWSQKLMKQTVKLRDRVRRISIISTLYAIGLVEAYYLPRYGIQWLLAGLMATVLLASFWIRSRWN
jgi:hypothetical protein